MEVHVCFSLHNTLQYSIHVMVMYSNNNDVFDNRHDNIKIFNVWFMYCSVLCYYYYCSITVLYLIHL